MSEKMEIVATATLTKDNVQRAILQSVLAAEENKKALEGQDLVAHYQFNPNHNEAFCLMTLTRIEADPQDIQESVGPSEEVSTNSSDLTDD
tara:strand:- start:229 stop:501 length:273 start_codon:yes stop_codon:yes gene_type:complete